MEKHKEEKKMDLILDKLDQILKKLDEKDKVKTLDEEPKNPPPHPPVGP